MKRYPGIQSFDKDYQNLFFGRDRETKELFRLTVLRPIVVLFGKSGTGKTSLIQAGITPLLHERRLHPVFLRLNQTQLPIPKQIYSILNTGEYLPYDTPSNLTLWDYCQLFDYNESGNTYIPLIVLDQFEELFTLYADKPDEQKRFITQLAQVMNGTAPEGNRRTAAPKVHFLISIRSDYLYLLDRLSDQIPAILRTRYELYDLDTENAKLAIEQPAAAAAQGTFDSPSFDYSPDALQNILSELSQKQENNSTNPTNEVGGFQLQLLCQRIEEKIIAQTTTTSAKQITVTPDFYEGSEGIRNIIGEFYDNVLQKYPEADTRRRIQQLAEQGLISNGRRVILEQEQIKQSYQLSQADLDLLGQTRLCRKENRAGLWYYEISHDTLLKPIIATYEVRRNAEEKARLEQEKAAAAEQAQKAAEQAQKDRELRLVAERAKRRANILAVIAMGIAILAVLAGVYAMQKKQEADEQKKNAATALQKAQKLINAFYFYDDKFALAFQSSQFYFIDKNGDAVKKLGRWDKAEQFDYEGFAKVEKKEWDKLIKKYLLDTLGNAYPVAYTIADLNPNITALDLSTQKLTILPERIWQNTQLKVLLLNNNQLITLPESMGKLTNLQTLDLSYNKGITLPESIGNLSNLQTLDLGHNQFSTLPESIGKLSKLQTLNLSYNQLSTLPESIGKLSKLQTLNLSYNQLSTLPESITKLINLQTLDLNSNKLSTLPESIGNLSNLQTLDLSFIKLKTLPESIGKLSKLQMLALRGNQLSILPESIGKLSNLQGLYLGDNQLSTLPESISKLSNLQELTLDDNKLSILPESITKLINLQTLDLSNNLLSTLPESIGKLSNLQTLNLSYNQLSTLPESMGNISNLQTLDLNSNKLSILPESIGKLSNLQTLDLRDNQLITLPQSIGKLSNLQTLGLEENKALYPYYQRIQGNELKDFLSKLAEGEIKFRSYKGSYNFIKKQIKGYNTSVTDWYHLSSSALFANKPQEAIGAAQKILTLAPANISVKAKLALGYLLNNEYPKAEAIYLEWRGKTFPNNSRPCNQIFLKDIADLEAAGVHHKDFEKVRELLK